MMTGLKKRAQHFTSAQKTRPERLGGNFLFRFPYLESRWMHVIFRVLIGSVAALLLLSSAAVSFLQVKENARTVRLADIEQSISVLTEEALQQQQKVSLTGEQQVLAEKLTLVQERILLQGETIPQGEELTLSARITELDQLIRETYLRGCTTKDSLEAVRLFSRIPGYREADKWRNLSLIRVKNEIKRARLNRQWLTAWILNTRLMTLLCPEKTDVLPVSFAPISGIWICREDQLSSWNDGEGRAGVRCLWAEEEKLRGGIVSDLFHMQQLSQESRILVQGGINSVMLDAAGLGNTDPACCMLQLSKSLEDGEKSSDFPDKIRIVSENVLIVEEGTWKGTYYRLLSESDT